MKRWITLAGLVCCISAFADSSLSILREGLRVKITFSGTLQSAGFVSGPWLTITNSASPWLDDLPPNAQKFYRIQPPAAQSIFASDSIAELLVTGPLQQYFALAFAGSPDGIFPPVRQKPYFDAAVKVPGFDLPVSLRVRGNSSLQECPFPKLKFKVSPEHRAGSPFFDAREVKIGTHCAEGGHGNIGRLRDERAAFREALVYDLMGLLGFVAPRVRRAQIDYHDTTPVEQDGGWQLVRSAFLLDDIEVVAERLGGRVLSDAELGALTNASFDEQLVAELEFFHALTGNWDFALSPGAEGLRNTDVIQLTNGQYLPVAGDFDLASMVTGEVRSAAPREYRPDLADVEREALYKLEQLQGRLPPSTFAAAAARFLDHRSALESRIAAAPLDDLGRTNALRHVAAFFDALSPLAPR